MNLKFWKQPVQEIQPVQEPIMSTKRNALMIVTVINNVTDKQYTFESINDFGLTWTFSNTNVLIINQQHSFDPSGIKENVFKATARLVNFSVLATEWQEFDIQYED